MCVNDILAQGADPLFFLDYFATGHLHPTVAEQVISGISEGCSQAGCALIGGETAEMPGLYEQGIYDLAGFSVGAVERDNILPRKDIEENDIILGLPASGVHSNGFSLVRKIIDDFNFDLSAPAPFDETTSLGMSLLEPTKIYVKALSGAVHAKKIKALAHITGGGLTGNVPRVLPDHLSASIDLDAWQPNPVFQWLKESGKIDDNEMLKTFNCGIGMVLITTPKHKSLLKKSLSDFGEELIELGTVTPRSDDPMTYSGQLF